MKILIAEDDPDYRMIVELTLKGAGHEVVTAQHGEDAWNRFQAETFPLVVTDWTMPYMDGPELCRCIRSLSRESYTYIIILTARAGKESLVEGLDAGADDFVRKPFDKEEFLARLRVAERIIRLHGHVTQLEGLLSICAYCKKIKDDGNQWLNVDRYIAGRTGVAFSHVICPVCRQREEAKLKRPA